MNFTYQYSSYDPFINALTKLDKEQRSHSVIVFNALLNVYRSLPKKKYEFNTWYELNHENLPPEINNNLITYDCYKITTGFRSDVFLQHCLLEYYYFNNKDNFFNNIKYFMILSDPCT